MILGSAAKAANKLLIGYFEKRRGLAHGTPLGATDAEWNAYSEWVDQWIDAIRDFRDGANRYRQVRNVRTDRQTKIPVARYRYNDGMDVPWLPPSVVQVARQQWEQLHRCYLPQGANRGNRCQKYNYKP